MLFRSLLELDDSRGRLPGETHSAKLQETGSALYKGNATSGEAALRTEAILKPLKLGGINPLFAGLTELAEKSGSRMWTTPGAEKAYNKAEGFWPAVREALRQLGVRRLAVEDDKLSLERGRALENLLPSLIGTTRLVQQLRAVKDAEELELLRRSARIAAEAFEAFLPAIRPGRSEAELAADLVHEIRRRGAQQMAKGHFVVASGPRGARPHGIFPDRVVQPGDFITMDFGAVYNGYVSDMTRTVGVGDVDPKLVEIYHIVREAHDRAIAAVSPDATGSDVDEAARSLIRGRGYGEFFSHSTGHGIGLELHELPVVNRMNGEKLPVGSVVTVEPGIYIDGLGGVRIEDDVIVTPHGAEVITSASGTELRLLSPA